MDKVIANVKSAWASKINWGQALALIAGLLTYFGIDLDADTQAAILTAIVAVQSVYTWVMRTFFTTDVTPTAAKTLPKA